MRLHLVIQRHGLPLTRILWTTSSPSALFPVAPQSPSNVLTSGGYTIAQLLEDINQVIPLETVPVAPVADGGLAVGHEASGQWGLEDYVVEIGGFECLHFMEVEGLLRDGDEVVIRALQTSDLRARRLSGRHQISVDGKHLIDGVPFGRPFLKRTAPSRPAITIPPRKRRRTLLTGWNSGAGYAEEDTEWALPPPLPQHGVFGHAADESAVIGEGTVIRHSIHNDNEQEEGRYSESDADVSEFEPESDGGDEVEDEDEEEGDASGLAEELAELKADLEKTDNLTGERNVDDRGQHSLQQTSLENPSRAPLSDCRLPMSPSILSSTRSMNRHSTPKVDSSFSRRGSKIVRFEKDGASLRALVNNVQQVSAAASKPQPPDVHTMVSPQIGSSDEEVESDSSAAASSSRDASVSDKMVSSPSEALSSCSERSSTSESDLSSSDSDADSTSESESEDEEEEDEEEEAEEAAEADREKIQTAEKQKAIPSTVTTTRPQRKVNPPGQGSSQTKKSNRRSKMRRRLSKLKELGALPPEADFAALRAWEEENGWFHQPPHPPPLGPGFVMNASSGQRGQRAANPNEQGAKIDENPVSEKIELAGLLINNAPTSLADATEQDEAAEFEAKRQKLLHDLMELDYGESDEAKSVGKDSIHFPALSSTIEIVADRGSGNLISNGPAVPQPVEEAMSEELVKRRTLDVESSRRLLFGSLGVRPPRSKDDEEAVRKKLAGTAKRVTSVQQQGNGERMSLTEDSAGQISSREANWQDKLIIKAIECVFEDIQLSNPPFPFQQYWDQSALEVIDDRRRSRGELKSRKRKRKPCVQYYEEDQDEYGENSYWNAGVDSYFEGDADLNYDDTAQAGHDGAAHEQPAVADAVLESENVCDSPPLPDNIDSMRDLVIADVRAGSMIAFKQLDMSKETNWQPTVSDYRIGVVDSIDGNAMTVRLAKRYRRQRKAEEGPRLYYGFEMPGFGEDDDNAEDDGYREVLITELIEPKMLCATTNVDENSQEANSLNDSQTRDSIANGELGAPSGDALTVSSVARSELKPDEMVPGTEPNKEGSAGTPNMFQGNHSSKSPEYTPKPPSLTSRAKENETLDSDCISIEVSISCHQEEDSHRNRRLQTANSRTGDAEENLSNTSSPLRADSDNFFLPSLQELFTDSLSYITTGEDQPTRSSPGGSKAKIERKPRPGELPSGSQADDSPPPRSANAKTRKRTRCRSKSLSGSNYSPGSEDNSTVPNPLYNVVLARGEGRQLRRSHNKRQLPNHRHGSAGDHSVSSREPSPVRSEWRKNKAKSADRHGVPTGKSIDVASAHITSISQPDPLNEIPESFQLLVPSESPSPLPSASARAARIVDLKESSPFQSPEGSDEDYAKAHRLSRRRRSSTSSASGWVQKIRSTRSSQQAQVQTLKEVSISPLQSLARDKRDQQKYKGKEKSSLRF